MAFLNTLLGAATAVHLHHIDPGFPPIYQEIATRLGQGQYVPAIRNDIVAADPGRKALAQEIDGSHYAGMPPYATYVARMIFVHSLAFNEQLKGLTPEHLRFSILGPETDLSFIDDARKLLRRESYRTTPVRSNQSFNRQRAQANNVFHLILVRLSTRLR